jgi:hypothetical protein
MRGNTQRKTCTSKAGLRERQAERERTEGPDEERKRGEKKSGRGKAARRKKKRKAEGKREGVEGRTINLEVLLMQLEERVFRTRLVGVITLFAKILRDHGVLQAKQHKIHAEVAKR